ncbi:MAG: hypothetical protein GWP08_04000 [Nitrospiraceae bacterium]|nr:hypothetical protein [Nitrospiraceae bacterium]
MPGEDRTGPWGEGPMTGRAAGLCTGNDMPGSANPQRARAFGRGMGFGRGRRGRRNQFNATGLTGWQRARQQETESVPQTQDTSQLSAVREQIGTVQEVLASLNERLAQLESRSGQ